MIYSLTGITIFVMDRKQFEKLKTIAIIALLCVFVIEKGFVYFQEKKEDNEIVFYSLPPAESSETLKETINEKIEEPEEETEDTRTVDEKSGKIDINKASSEELQELNGIGPALASRIIEYRKSYGDFVSIEEIMEVKGIGEKTFAKIKDHICVK